MENADYTNRLVIDEKVEPDCFKTHHRPRAKTLQLWVTRMIGWGATRMITDSRSGCSNGFSEADGEIREIQGDEVVTKLARHVIQ